MKTKFLIILLSFSLGLISCSSDDNNESVTCIPTNMSMTINGEPLQYQGLSSGIVWNPARQIHIIDQNFYYRGAPFGDTNVYYSVPHKRKGKDVFEVFMFTANINGSHVEVNLLNEDFESEVITSSNTCFYAIFSGKFIVNDQEVIITEGIASYTFSNPIQIN